MIFKRGIYIVYGLLLNTSNDATKEGFMGLFRASTGDKSLKWSDVALIEGEVVENANVQELVRKGRLIGIDCIK